MKPPARRARHYLPVHSALYQGVVSHARYGRPAHSFSYETALCYLDLAELCAVLGNHPLWSNRRWHPVQFRRSDYTGDTSAQLGESVRRAAAGSLGGHPTGPVRLLAYPRTWGWCFNPLALAFCFHPDGRTLQAVVATVTNTPWGERHDYVLPALPDGTVDTWVKKELHVSPYFPMGQSYRFRLRAPGDRFALAVDVHQAGQKVLAARLSLLRRPLDRAAMTKLLWQLPAPSWRVSAGIYWQAALLLAKGARFYPHPERPPVAPGPRCPRSNPAPEGPC